MMRGTVVLLGSLPAGRVPLSDTAAEFGWSLDTVADVDGLQELNGRRQVVAVLFDPKASQDLSEETHVGHAIHSVRSAAPDAFLIACQKFSDPIPWPELASQGAFHSLSLPLHASELRNSLGFVWAARRRHSVIPLNQAVLEAERETAQHSLDGVEPDEPASSLPERGRAAGSVA
jgi:hypothetical protein